MSDMQKYCVDHLITLLRVDDVTAKLLAARREFVESERLSLVLLKYRKRRQKRQQVSSSNT